MFHKFWNLDAASLWTPSSIAQGSQFELQTSAWLSIQSVLTSQGSFVNHVCPVFLFFLCSAHLSYVFDLVASSVLFWLSRSPVLTSTLVTQGWGTGRQLWNPPLLWLERDEEPFWRSDYPIVSFESEHTRFPKLTCLGTYHLTCHQTCNILSAVLNNSWWVGSPFQPCVRKLCAFSVEPNHTIRCWATGSKDI